MLTSTMNADQTELTAVSDKRKHAAVPAQTEAFVITVEASGETRTYSGTRVITPAQPAYTDPITITEDTGRVWTVKSDDGITTVFH